MTSDLSGNSRIGGPIRVATLGGGVGSLMGDVHRLSLQLAGGHDLLAGCFSDVEAENWETATSLGIDQDRVYGDEHALVEAETGREDGVEAVIILTPNHLHAVQARACLIAGLDVICEKPLYGHLTKPARWWRWRRA